MRRNCGFEGVLGEYRDKRLNEAGKLMLEIFKERNLIVANKMFGHKEIYMYTSGRTEGKSIIIYTLFE